MAAQQPYVMLNVNDSLVCSIFPRERFPDGLNLTYASCPDEYDNATAKLIRYCCLNIMFETIQNSFYKRTQDWLRHYSSSVLVVPAILFNTLSLVVLGRFRMRGVKTSTTFYMKCVCLFDILAIISKCLNETIVVRNSLRDHPLVITSFMCKWLSFFEECTAITSIYLLIAMSVDKLVCVLRPLEVGQLLTPRRAKCTFVLIFVASAIASAYNLFDKRAFKFESSEIDTTSHPQQQQQQHEQQSGESTSIADTYAPSINGTNYDGLPSLLLQPAPLATSQSSISSSPVEYRVAYDCDSNWPELVNDWILFSNIVRVFLPIALLCLFNSGIVISLYRETKRSNTLFSKAARQSVRQEDEQQHAHGGGGGGGGYTMQLDPVAKASRATSRLLLPLSTSTVTTQPNANEQTIPYRHRPTRASIAAYKETNKKSKIPLINIRDRNVSQQISISVMLFAVSFGFVVLNLPFAIRTLFHRQFKENFKLLDYL